MTAIGMLQSEASIQRGLCFEKYPEVNTKEASCQLVKAVLEVSRVEVALGRSTAANRR